MGFEPSSVLSLGRSHVRSAMVGAVDTRPAPCPHCCQQGYIWPHICIAASRRTWATSAALGGVRAPGDGGAGNCHTWGQESPGRRLFIAELFPLGHSLHPGSSGRMRKMLLSCDFVSPVVHPTASPHLPFGLLGSPFLQQLEEKPTDLPISTASGLIHPPPP